MVGGLEVTDVFRRHRHCPKCQGAARAAWVAPRRAEPPPAPYFYVIFTLPARVGAITYQSEPRVRDRFEHRGERGGLRHPVPRRAAPRRAATETLRGFAADPRHLGAEIGVVAVPLTWGQAMQHHPHVHCIVPGGGLSPDRARRIACPPVFFLSLKVLGGLFLERLAAAFVDGEPRLFRELVPRAEPNSFAAHCAALRRIDWVVYAESAYLGRFTHRVAIANSRLVAMTDEAVSFLWKDYRQEGCRKVMTLEWAEFIRRFLSHVLPAGFHRIRPFGFLANGHRAVRLALCRRLRAQPVTDRHGERGAEPDSRRGAYHPEPGVRLPPRRPRAGSVSVALRAT